MQRIPPGDEYRNVRFGPEPPPHGYIPPAQHRMQQEREFPHPVYREQERQFLPPHQSDQRLQQAHGVHQPTERYNEQTRQANQWPVHSDEQPVPDSQEDLEDDSRTVIMGPADSRLNQNLTQDATESSERFLKQTNQLEASYDDQDRQEQQHVTFHNGPEQEDTGPEGGAAKQDIEPNPEEDHKLYSEEQYQRKQSLRVRSQPLSTEDSVALSGKDKLGPLDTDAFDSRETHEESDRLGPRTTEDDVSRTEEQNHNTEGEEDSDSGIGKDGTALRLKKSNLMEKKSLFTIAYDGMQTRGLKSAGDRDDSP